MTARDPTSYLRIRPTQVLNVRKNMDLNKKPRELFQIFFLGIVIAGSGAAFYRQTPQNSRLNKPIINHESQQIFARFFNAFFNGTHRGVGQCEQVPGKKCPPR
ncbi:MAG: hypothetical protein MUC97_07745 [Bernardetiaceae bacterium]|jgi:hypothetical protein|nr:hypothetical protein [Bernardetiaceae bacterium]